MESATPWHVNSSPAFTVTALGGKVTFSISLQSMMRPEVRGRRDKGPGCWDYLVALEMGFSPLWNSLLLLYLEEMRLTQKHFEV